MCQKIFDRYPKCFKYKAGCPNCHDWQLWELSKQADAVCNWVLDDKADIDQCDIQLIARKLTAGQVVHPYPHGGFDSVSGAAAFVIVCSKLVNGDWRAEIGGHHGVILHQAMSAFHAEIVGAEKANLFAFELSRRPPVVAKRRRFLDPSE